MALCQQAWNSPDARNGFKTSKGPQLDCLGIENYYSHINSLEKV